MSGFVPPGLGWYPGVPDYRDYSPELQEMQEILEGLKRPRARRPTAVDLREYFPEAYHQQGLNSSTAQAVAGLVAYFERRAFGRVIQPSRLYLYKVTRKLLGVTGDVGADLRTTLRATALFGMPPERYRPHEPDRFDEEPEAFEYTFGDEYRAIQYLRLDVRNGGGKRTLALVKAFLEAGFPCVFGFSVPASITRESDIPYRPTFDSVRGGQAAVAVGYDDRRLVTTRGALLIRNSWGTEWGEQGYGWLPYAYVEEQLAVSFWTLLHPDWLEAGDFRQPRQ